MSGGSWDYLYSRVREAAERLQEPNQSPLRQELGRHVALVATALHDVEWYDSGDYGEEHEDGIRACLSPETVDTIRLAEWTARARAAELASERKEHLLALQSAALTQQERIVLAVGLSIDGAHQPALYLQSNHGDESETLARLSKAIGPYLMLLVRTIRSKGRMADTFHDLECAERDVDVLDARNAELKQENESLRQLLQSLMDCPGNSSAWERADQFLRGVTDGPS